MIVRNLCIVHEISITVRNTNGPMYSTTAVRPIIYYRIVVDLGLLHVVAS